jgi:hypothetical protein
MIRHYRKILQVGAGEIPGLPVFLRFERSVL